VTSFQEPLKVFKLLTGFEKPWFVAGGWAIDLYLGQVTRPHRDIEIAILRADQLAFQNYMRDWELVKVIPESGGRREPWDEGEWLELPVHELHARREGEDPKDLEILLNESWGEEWRFRRNLDILRPLSKIGQLSGIGIPLLSPEIVLLYKAKKPTAVDQIDFKNVSEVLKGKPRRWLRKSIETCYPKHPWLDLLSEGCKPDLK